MVQTRSWLAVSQDRELTAAQLSGRKATNKSRSWLQKQQCILHSSSIRQRVANTFLSCFNVMLFRVRVFITGTNAACTMTPRNAIRNASIMIMQPCTSSCVPLRPTPTHACMQMCDGTAQHAPAQPSTPTECSELNYATTCPHQSTHPTSASTHLGAQRRVPA